MDIVDCPPCFLSAPLNVYTLPTLLQYQSYITVHGASAGRQDIMTGTLLLLADRIQNG